jgi:hypothetical protein
MGASVSDVIEFELAADCCQLAFNQRPRFPSELGAIDWQLFYRLAQFHRIQGLIWWSLSALGNSIPADVARRIAEDAARIAAANRLSLEECRELGDALAGKGIDFLILKGLPLGVLAYGTPWLKAAVDIDVLIDEGRLGDALGVLRASGFVREDGRAQDPAALHAWHRHRKDSEWGKAGSTARVDLHTRVTDNVALIPTVGLRSPRQVVAITPDVALPTLGDDELFAHLCVHGASSAWFRLKWVTDLAALLTPKPAEEIARLYARSQELGAGRAAGQALLLADALFGLLDRLPQLRAGLASDRPTRWLSQLALRQLAGRREPVEPTARAGGTMAIHLSQFFLLPGARFKASELFRQARAALARKLSQ